MFCRFIGTSQFIVYWCHVSPPICHLWKSVYMSLCFEIRMEVGLMRTMVLSCKSHFFVLWRLVSLSRHFSITVELVWESLSTWTVERSDELGFWLDILYHFSTLQFHLSIEIFIRRCRIFFVLLHFSSSIRSMITQSCIHNIMMNAHRSR